MTGSEKMAAEFVAVVKRTLATLPAPLVTEADLDDVVAEVVERIVAAYPKPKRGLTHVWNAGAGVFWPRGWHRRRLAPSGGLPQSHTSQRHVCAAQHSVTKFAGNAIFSPARKFDGGTNLGLELLDEDEG